MGKAVAFVSVIMVLDIILVASGDTEPTCRRYMCTCEEPQPPKHGSVQLLGGGRLARYSCNPGSTLYGTISSWCLISGKWDSDPPKCLSSCKVPFIENGDIGWYEISSIPRNSRKVFKKVSVGEYVKSGDVLFLNCRNGTLPIKNSEIEIDKSKLSEVTCSDGTWSTDLQCKQNGKDRATSITEPGVTPSALGTIPNIINVKSSSHPTSDITGHEDCFCSYEYEDQLVNAYIGHRTLKFRERLRRGEVVSFECKFHGRVLTWENGLRLSGKASMTCNTCKPWERKDVPICKNLEINDAVISYNNNFLPGGIINIQKQGRQRFSCSNIWRQPDWDYGQRRGVSVSKTQVPGRGSVHYISYLDIDNDAKDISGEYECFVYDDLGQRSGSTSLHLQVNEVCSLPKEPGPCKNYTIKWFFDVAYGGCSRFWYGGCDGNGNVFSTQEECESVCVKPDRPDSVSCSKFADSSELLVNYSKGVSIGSVATFNCSATTRYLIGSNYSVCQEDGNWNNPLPSCEDSKCSIHDLAISIPEGIEPDISNVTGENVMFGSKVKLMCTDNSVMSGDSQAQCGEHGKWKLGNYQCVLGCIINLDPSSHLVVQPKKDRYMIGDSVLLSCPRGEEMSAKVERVMCLPSGWSDSLPECKEPGKNDER